MNTTPAPSSHSIRPYLLILAASMSFAAMNAFAHALTDRCDWRLIAVARTGLMFVFAVILALRIGAPLAFLRPAGLWIRSIAGSIGLLCTFYAVTHMHVSDAITIMNTVPVWVTILSWISLRRNPGWKVWAAVVASIVGAACVAQPEFASGRWGAVAALGNSIFTAISVWQINRMKGVNTWTIVVHFAGLSTLVALGVCLSMAGPGVFAAVLNPRVALLLLGVGVSGTVGQVTITGAFMLGSAPRVAVVGLTTILFGAALDIVIWSRTWDALTVLGMILVTIPTAWLLLRPALMKAVRAQT